MARSLGAWPLGCTARATTFLTQYDERGWAGDVLHDWEGTLADEATVIRLPPCRTRSRQGELLCLGLRELFCTGVGNSRVRRLAPLRSSPSTCFAKLPLPPRLDLLELRQLCGRARLLHEFRD